MKRVIFFISIFFCYQCSAQSCVVLLHGLARTSNAMLPMQKALQQKGYLVANIDYPSRKYAIETLAEQAVSQGIDACNASKTDTINFVTHSMGGILLRQYFKQHPTQAVHRVVMLGPPNGGSQVVDRFKNTPGFAWLNGPAGAQLGTQGLPAKLGPANFNTGIISGTRSINWLLSAYLPNPDDGKVSVNNTKLSGMCGFISIPSAHPFLMRNKQAIRQTIHYIEHGHFKGQAMLPGCIMATTNKG